MAILDILGKIGFDWQVAVANLVNFLIIFFILKRYAFKPIANIIKERQDQVNEGLDNAKLAETNLMQAEQEKEDKKKIYVQKIIDFLIEEGIDESEIAIKTGKQDQISDIDLFSKKCPIRYILTVNALKEGWDNSFAYVLISVANIESRISVEQTIGRIIRLPNTKEKKQEDLNVSYVYTSSRNFKEAASSLEKGLLANGYSKKDFKELTKTIEKENIFGTQFHPEKSDKIGLKIINNFINL